MAVFFFILPHRITRCRHLIEKARWSLLNHRLARQRELSLRKIRIRNTESASNGLMRKQAFLEYRAKLISTPHTEEQGEPIHCLIKIEIGADDQRSRALLEQEAGDLILFSVNPGPHRRITHSSIDEVDEKRLHQLGPAADFNRVGNTEIYFYSS